MHPNLGHKKGGVHTERPLGECLIWHGYVDFIEKREKACFLTKTSLFAYPLVEISGIEPLTS